MEEMSSEDKNKKFSFKEIIKSIDRIVTGDVLANLAYASMMMLYFLQYVTNHIRCKHDTNICLAKILLCCRWMGNPLPVPKILATKGSLFTLWLKDSLNRITLRKSKHLDYFVTTFV